MGLQGRFSIFNACLSIFLGGNDLTFVLTTGTNRGQCWVLGADPPGVDPMFDLD